MSGRAVLIVLLGWFLALLAAPVLGGLAVRALPALRPLLLPLVYGCHALAGVWLLCRAEGTSPAGLARRVAPERHRTALANGLGFFALAFAAVLAVAVVLGPILSRGEPPQKELMEFLARFRGTWTLALLFLTVAVLAPTFEELMFRGFLLPWLGERLEPRLGARPARLAAVGISGLGFGLMHMQPLGLPTLTTLGIVLGLAFARTGNLVSAIVVHGLWNGGVFLLIRHLG
jgi:membrane protease YdiL (CAAX protease family)